MIIALATATVLSAMMLVVIHANQPKAKPVPVRARMRDPRIGRRPHN